MLPIVKCWGHREFYPNRGSTPMLKEWVGNTCVLCLCTLLGSAQTKKHGFTTLALSYSWSMVCKRGCAYAHAFYWGFQREKGMASLLLALAYYWSTGILILVHFWMCAILQVHKSSSNISHVRMRESYSLGLEKLLLLRLCVLFNL